MSRLRFAVLFVATVALAALAFEVAGPLGGESPRQRRADELERRYESLWACRTNGPRPRVTCRPQAGSRYSCKLTPKGAAHPPPPGFEPGAGVPPPPSDC